MSLSRIEIEKGKEAKDGMTSGPWGWSRDIFRSPSTTSKALSALARGSSRPEAAVGHMNVRVMGMANRRRTKTLVSPHE